MKLLAVAISIVSLLLVGCPTPEVIAEERPHIYAENGSEIHLSCQQIDRALTVIAAFGKVAQEGVINRGCGTADPDCVAERHIWGQASIFFQLLERMKAVDCTEASLPLHRSTSLLLL